jgi:xanthine dehydrogenase accessory factor
VVLAGGTSSRMGRPKASVSVGGQRMLERILVNLREAEVDRVVVVLGFHADEVRAAVDLRSATVVENPHFAEGMSSSLRVGVRAVAADCKTVMVVLGDQPFVTPETFRRLVRRAEAADGAIFIPTYKGVWGNPVLFDTSLAPEMNEIEGDVGCRALFPQHSAEIREVPVDDPAVLVDIDTESELREVDSAIVSGEPMDRVLDRLSAPRWSLHASPADHPVPKRLRRPPDVLGLAHQLRSQRVPFALATVVRAVRPTSGRPGYSAIIREDGTHVGWVGGACTEHLLVSEAQAALRAGVPRLLRVSPDPESSPPAEGVVNRAMMCRSGGTVEIFIEPNLPKPTLLIVGDSPVATSLTALGPLLGYRVVLVAPGAEASEMPDADEFVSDLASIPEHLTSDTYAVVASMGKYDESGLAPIVRASVAFVGLVASRTRARSVFAALKSDGAAAAQIARVRNPVGIDLAASTPEEIALSIMAEIIRVRRTTPVAPPSPVATSPASEVATDPVCQMEVERSSPLRATHAGRTYYFCSEACRRKFSRTPTKFLV